MNDVVDAPRYTTSLPVLNNLAANGWTSEGEAQNKVFACVPAP
ncbi:MAG TPA: hypothetical protein VNE58_15850 [Casimicrobiaceae bacterium]|nr:hypothetical protein [Casimicrobiaceae bacterium]